jgi:hypothetical protein
MSEKVKKWTNWLGVELNKHDHGDPYQRCDNDERDESVRKPAFKNF